MDFREAGQRGGSATTPAKVAAAQENGRQPVRKGRRPRGRPAAFVTLKLRKDELKRRQDEAEAIHKWALERDAQVLAEMKALRAKNRARAKARREGRAL